VFLVPGSFVRGGNDGTKSIPQGKNGIKNVVPVPGSSFLDPSFRELR
jgi:hypothetical protein